MEFDPREFRKILGNFLTGVTIITGLDPDGLPRGLTANSFSSVSLDPPIILVCVAKSSSSLEIFKENARFAVNILADGQRELSDLFASKSQEKFSGNHWSSSPRKCPIIPDSLVVLECLTEQLINAGDHWIVLGRVTDFSQNEGVPLGFCRGAYLSPVLTQTAVSLAGGTSVIGALLECDNRLLLVENSNGEVALPQGQTLGEISSPSSLCGKLYGLGITASVDFLFSVFEDPQTNETFIYYRGSFQTVRRDPAITTYEFSEIPYERLSAREARLIRRFVAEKQQEISGLYVGSQTAGAIFEISGSQKWNASEEAMTS